MANVSAPNSKRFKGWYFDAVNNRLEYYYNGTKVGHLSANGMSITDDSTSRMADGVLDSNALSGTVLVSDVEAKVKQHVVRLGTIAAAASNGAGALMSDMKFVAPAAIKIVSAWAANISASDVTTGTATSSASYRRMTLIANTAGTGSGTDIVCSLNATASSASNATRAFTTVNSAIPAGSIILASHLTVGAETADGTDMAARIVQFVYELQ
jgi:hypothetical protein